MNSRAAKNLAHKLSSGIIDMFGNRIANFIGAKDYKVHGEIADEARQKILNRRESRRNDKMMGY